MLLLLPGLSAAGNEYAEQHASAVRACEVVDPKEYHSGLWLNPEGYRSYYLRSLCYQKAAKKFRDHALCAQVRQRRSLFASSWGYSQANCEKLVAEGIAKDRETIERMKTEYARGHVRLSGFRVERNGNGRDIDIIPEFSGSGEHGYELRFEIIPKDPATEPVLLKAAGFYLKGNTSNIRIYVPQEDIRERFPEFTLDQSWPVRASLVYSIGTGSPAGKWSDAFIERHFPASTRTQTLLRELRF